MKNRRIVSLMLLLPTALIAIKPVITQADEWTGNGTSLNWSDTGNWDTVAVPSDFSSVYFSDLLYPNAYTNAVGLVNNVVDGGNLTIRQLAYTSTNGHFFTTLIPAGGNLIISGSGAEPVLASGNTLLFTAASGTSNVRSNYASIAGEGSLLVTNENGYIEVWQAATTTSSLTTPGATLDLSNLSNFTARVGQVRVGVTPFSGFTSGSQITGQLRLARTNQIETVANTNAPGILLGRTEYGVSATTAIHGGGQLVLGVENTFNTDALIVGGSRGTSIGVPSQIAFDPGSTGNHFVLRGSAGGSTPIGLFNVADATAREDGYAGEGISFGVVYGSADFTGGNVDILADQMFVGRSTPTAVGTGRGSAIGSLTMDTGTLTASNLYAGYYQGSIASTYAQGTVTLNGTAVMNIDQDVELGHGDGAFSSTVTMGTLNVNENAKLNVFGNIINGTGTANLNLGGGTVDLQPGGDLTAGDVGLDNLSGSGVITNANNVTVSGDLIPGTSVTEGALYVDGNFAMPSGTIYFNIGTNNGVNTDGNDYVRINGSTVSFNGPRMYPTFAGPLLPSTTYTLMEFPNATSVSGFIDAETPRYAPVTVAANSVVMTIAAVTNGGVVTWQGNVGDIWNTSVANTNWLYEGAPDSFRQFDDALFNDTAVGTTILLDGSISPNSITFNNSSKDFTFGPNTSDQTGWITGPTGLTKEGTGVVTLANNYQHDFTGPVNINAGILSIGRANTRVFGDNPDGYVSIASGGTLDFGYTSTASIGSSSGANTRRINIAGNGAAGTGAITVTSGNGLFYTPEVNLTADAMVGSDSSSSSGYLQFQGLNATPVETGGSFNLAGHTLTKVGSKSLVLYRMTLPDSGNIQVEAGELQIYGTVVLGSGAVTLSDETKLSFRASTGYTNRVDKTLNVPTGSATIAAPYNGSADARLVYLGGPVDLGGSLTVSNRMLVTLEGIISGPGGLTKSGLSNLVLEAANTYVGPTEIRDGSMILSSTASLASSNIAINTGGSFDVTSKGVGGYALGAAQAMDIVGVNGAIYGDITLGSGASRLGVGTNFGNLTANAGGLVAPGSVGGVGTMTIANALTLNSASVLCNLGSTIGIGGTANDLIRCGDLTLTGTSTVTIVPIGAMVSTPGQRYTVIQYTGALVGDASNLNVISSNPHYSFVASVDTVNKRVEVQVTAIPGGTVWRGLDAGNPTAWDFTTTNWFFNGNPTVYFDGDTTVFDHTGLTNTVTLVGDVAPAAMMVSNNASTYQFVGAGRLQAGELTIAASSTGGAVLGNSTSNSFLGNGITLDSGTTLTANQPVNTSLSGILNGSGTLLKSGTNTLTLVGNSTNSFSGTNRVVGGTLRPGNPEALGGALATVDVVAGGGLDLAGQKLAVANLKVAGAGTGAGAVINSGATLYMSNAPFGMILTGPTALGGAGNLQVGRWTLDPAGTAVYNPPQQVPDGAYFNAQSNSLTKLGSGDVRINFSNESYLADINVGAGRLIFNDPSVTSVTEATLGYPQNTITVSNGATLGLHGLELGIVGQLITEHAYSGINTGTKPINLLAGSQLRSLGGSNYVGGTVSLASNVIIGARREYEPPYNAGNTFLNFGGTIQGEADLVVSNDFTGSYTILSGMGAYSGNTVVRRGNLAIANAIAVPANTTVYLTNQSLLQLQDGVAAGPDRSLSMSGGSYLYGLGSWSGPITLSGAGTCSFVGLPDTTGLELFGPITTGTGTVSVVFGRTQNIVDYGVTRVRLATPLNISGSASILDSQGTEVVELTLEQQNNWAGLSVSRGMVLCRTNDALAPGKPISGSIPQFGTMSIDFGGYDQTVSTLNVSLFNGSASCVIGNGAPSTLATLTHTGPGSSSYGGAISDNVLGGGPDAIMALNVTGGTLSLNNINNYTGPTIVSGGTLRVGAAGELGFTSVNVSGTGTLGGSGLIYGTVTNAAGGTISPGASIGTLTVNNTVTLESGSTCLMEVDNDAGSNDVLMASSIAFGGTLFVQNIGSAVYTNGQVLQLFSPGNTGAFDSIVIPGAVAYDASNLAAAGTITIVTGTPTTPTSIDSTVVGNQLQLSWPLEYTGWKLQAQTNDLSIGLTGTWFDVPNSSMTNVVWMPINAANGSVFFRLTLP